MPVDPMLADPMLSTFRNMAAEIQARRLTGPAVDAMNAELAKMEGLARDLTDFAAFSARLVQEGCFTSFSHHYGQALAQAARAEGQASAAAGGDPDAGLLAQSVAAYQQAAERYRAEAAAGRLSTRDAATLTAAVQAVLELGRSGVTYPVFLRELVERGLDRVLEGSALVRDGLVRDLEWARFANRPLEIELRTALLAAFDELAAAAPFGVPDALAFELRRQRLEWERAPALARWQAVTRRWQHLLTLVCDWLDSFTSFAPTDPRWTSMGGPAQTRRNLRRTQQVAPYRLRERERIFGETCGLAWADIFTHETYANAWHNVDLALSAAKLNLVLAAHARCVPGGQPTADQVATAEQLHRDRADHRFTELADRAERMRRRYDELHGDGAYARDFPGHSPG